MSNTETAGLYIDSYKSGHPHRWVIEKVDYSGKPAVDAVFAARHADLPPEVIAFVLYDEADGDYGVLLEVATEDADTAAERETEWYADLEQATARAEKLVRGVVANMEQAEREQAELDDEETETTA
jgi:hypothetical protein